MARSDVSPMGLSFLHMVSVTRVQVIVIVNRILIFINLVKDLDDRCAGKWNLIKKNNL